MIKSYSLGNYSVYEKEDGNDYRKILSSFLSGEIEKKLIQQGAKGEVWKISHGDVFYALKINKPKNKMAGRRVKALFRGSYFSSLIFRVDKARSENCFLMCDVYLVAEIKQLRFARESIVLMEWIDGPLLSESDELRNSYKYDVKALLKELHLHGISSGDVHPGNFIVSNKGLKIIDLSGRGASAIDRAKDFIGLKNKFGIDANHSAFADVLAANLIIFRSRLRVFLKKIRGRY